jgi:dolichol-phosphate mannosyltransferase
LELALGGNQLTIVIPTYNEAENLPGLVAALLGLPIPDLHILVVDDNSRDGTGELADRLSQESGGRLSVLHRPGKLGLGSAYLQGFRQAMLAGAAAVGQMDADFSHPPELILTLFSQLEHCDLAMGSRYIPGGSVDCNWPAWRKGLSAFGNAYSRAVLQLPVRDATGGYRLWRSAALQRIPLERVRSNGYAFQVEMVYLANCLGLSIQEVPFYFADRTQGGSKMSLSIQVEAALRVWQMKFAYRDLKPR